MLYIKSILTSLKIYIYNVHILCILYIYKHKTLHKTLRMQSIIQLLIPVYRFLYITNLKMYIMFLITKFTRTKSETDII